MFRSKHENSRNFTDKLRGKKYFLENRKGLGDSFNPMTQKIRDMSHWVRKWDSSSTQTQKGVNTKAGGRETGVYSIFANTGDATDRWKFKIFSLTTKIFLHQPASFKNLLLVRRIRDNCQKRMIKYHLPEHLWWAQTHCTRGDTLTIPLENRVWSPSQKCKLKYILSNQKLTFVLEASPWWLQKTIGCVVCKLN